jgi:hypothetical protein
MVCFLDDPSFSSEYTMSPNDFVVCERDLRAGTSTEVLRVDMAGIERLITGLSESNTQWPFGASV